MGIEGEWLYTHQDSSMAAMIRGNGWRPDLNTGSKFGRGIYLARDFWYPGAACVIRCTVSLNEHELMEQFPEARGFEREGVGNSEGHFNRYLSDQGLVRGRPKVERGSSPQNVRIAEFFLRKEIKAVHFVEYGHDALVVYDVSAITITP